MTTARRQAAELIERAWSADSLRRSLSDFARERSRPLYLVGGAVRDIVLGREVGDWDLAGPGAVELARAWADENDLRLVMLHENLPTARVITSPGDPNGFVDFSDLRADGIEDDLRARDFTINAMAWDLRGADEALDPTDGLADLRGELMRVTSLSCLEDDPLRTLRAFRLAAELGFAIEQQTGEWIGQCGARISEVSGERVGQEMLKLFAAPHCADAVQLAEDLGALHHFIPAAAAMRGVIQGGYHHLDVMGHTLLALHEAERVINEPALALPRSAEAVGDYLADGQRRAAVRMAALFHDIGKPACRTVEDGGRVRFFGHEDESAIIFSRLAKAWALPGVVRREVVTMVRLHMRPLQLVNEALRKLAEGQPEEKALTLSAIRRIMQAAEPAGIGLMLLASADRAACRGPSSDFEHRRQVMAMLDSMLSRYLSWLAEQRSLPRLVTGHDLMAEFDLSPGEIIGELLDAIARAQEDGQVKTREEALAVARRVQNGKKW
jgi:poly(A) polymerase